MKQTQSTHCQSGQPWPLGATAMTWQEQDGVNFAVYAPHAHGVQCCLFDAPSQQQSACLVLPNCTDGVWHGFMPNLKTGQLYGLRAQGPYAPSAGHRFNDRKLLVDPYARELVGPLKDLAKELDYWLDESGQHQLELTDNAARIPKARVVDVEKELRWGAGMAPGPNIALSEMVLYEAHVKGLTKLNPRVEAHLQGTYAGLASDPMLSHYKQLGITSLCLLPVQLHITEKHLLDLGLVNYWGYNTLGFFIPEPSYAGSSCGESARFEFRAMVDKLHRHGFEVLLDVVFNHTAESDAKGPTLCWRGLHNAGAYALDGAGLYQNPTGCGNALSFGEPRMVQLVMDSLRWWVQAFGVDGFRFDLATTLGRDPALHSQFNRCGALLTAISQDPVLSAVKRIAEPWDIGNGGYQLGGFSAGWQEWNDQFRDTVRAYWLGHACTRGQFARRLSGSSDVFQHNGRSPLASINLITSHDGFTLADLTAYSNRHNHANGENNRDGHSHNLSANAGIEGPSHDPQVKEQRALWQRAMLATLFLAQGIPQLLAGDELGHSQGGNNNAYCQDNAVTWLDWAHSDAAMIGFVGSLIALRKRYSALRHPSWFKGLQALEDGDPPNTGCDITWLKPEGIPLSVEEWQNPHELGLACVMEVGEGQRSATQRVMLMFNPADRPLRFELPKGPWRLVLNTATAEFECAGILTGQCPASRNSVMVLVQDIDVGLQESIQ